jgi:CCR4-NOT transcription complex subunit 1
LQDPFPLHAIYGSLWKNTEGQLSFLKHAVLAPPEVFTFAQSERQLVWCLSTLFFRFRSEVIPFLIMKSYLLFLQNYIDALHGHKLQVGHSNHAWVCLDLLDMLCQLAERGHASSVRSMLEYPLKHCPELLLLGMSHINVLLLFYS